MQTPAQGLIENYPDEFFGEDPHALDKEISDKLINPETRAKTLAFLRDRLDYDGKDDRSVMMDVLMRTRQKAEPKPVEQQTMREQMDEASRDTQATGAEAIYEKAMTADQVVNNRSRTPTEVLEGLSDPSHVRRIFAQNFTPDEIADDKVRIDKTFGSWEEAKKIQAENPGSEIFSDGVHVYINDESQRTIAQGRDDFVSWSPTDVSYSADSALGKAGQFGLGMLTGAGDPLQQAGANLLDNMSRPAGPDHKATYRPGFGLPELGQERGRQLGELLNGAGDSDMLTPTAEAALGLSSFASRGLGHVKNAAHQVKAGLMGVGGRRTPEEIQAEVEAGWESKADMDWKAKELGEGMPDVPPDPALRRELSQDLGEAAGRTVGVGAQMLSPTGGAKAISSAIGPLLRSGGNVWRKFLGEKIADESPGLQFFHDAPSTMAVTKQIERDSLDGAMQARRTAPDIYARQIASRVGDEADPIWKDLHEALGTPEVMTKTRQKYGDARVNSAMDRLMAVRRNIDETYTPAGQPLGPKIADREQPRLLDVERSYPPDHSVANAPAEIPRPPTPEPVQQNLLDVEPSYKPSASGTQGHVWTGRGLGDVRLGESLEAAKKRVFADRVRSDSGMSAREKDLLQKQLDDADALTTTAQTARHEFVKSGGPDMEMMRSIQKSIERGEIDAQHFGKWYNDWNAQPGRPGTSYSQPMFAQKITKEVQDNIKGDGKALILIDDGTLPEIVDGSIDRRAVFVVPSTGSSELDKTIAWKVVDRPVAQAIHQMSNPNAVKESAERAAKVMDDFLASSATAESLTRGNPGFQPFQRASEIARTVIDSPSAMTNGSRDDVAKLFSNQLDPNLTEQFTRQGSVGYGRTADLLRTAEKPQHLLGERYVKDQGGKAAKVYRGLRKARDVLMVPGEASSIASDAATRKLFPGLPPHVTSEDAIRAWHTLSLIREGVKPTVAIQQSNRLLVNFADKSAAQVLANPGLLFVKWQSASMKGAVDAAMRSPDRYRHLYDAMRTIETADTEAHDGKPISAKAKEPWQNFAGIPIIEMGGQLATVKVPGPGTELGDSAEMLSNTMRWAGGAKPAGPTVLGMINPTVQGVWKTATGEDMATGRSFGVANKGWGQEVYNQPEYKGGGLFGVAAMQRKNPELFPPEALLGRNPELAAGLEYTGALGSSLVPPYALDAARVALGRQSPARLDPESQAFYKKRKALQYGPGIRIAPFDPFIASMTRARHGNETTPAVPEDLTERQMDRGRLPETPMTDDQDDLLLRFLREDANR